MKNFYLTLWTVILLFFLTMVGVTALAFMRRSTSTGMDPAQIHQLRELASKKEM